MAVYQFKPGVPQWLQKIITLLLVKRTNPIEPNAPPVHVNCRCELTEDINELEVKMYTTPLSPMLGYGNAPYTITGQPKP